MKTLLTREEFKKQVFARDNDKCIYCSKVGVDAHHLIERKLFSDGGYYLDNGVTLCELHHWDAERTRISCDMLRAGAKIRNVILPNQFDDQYEYDKWGNILLLTNVYTYHPDQSFTSYRQVLVPGPLFYEENVQKVLKWKLIPKVGDPLIILHTK